MTFSTISSIITSMKSRSDSEILDLIIGTAKDDANIRAIVLEGSRANSNAAKDPFQDYDVIYGVTDLKPYKNNQEWIKRFSELLILQMPDGMGESPALDHKFTYRMQFSDGNNPGFPTRRLRQGAAAPNA